MNQEKPLTDATITKLLEKSAENEPVRPLDEEYEHITGELRSLRQTRLHLEQIAVDDDTPIPGFEPKTIGEHVYGAKASARKVPTGHKLEEAIAVARAREAAMVARLQDWDARDKAWRVHQEAKAEAEAEAQQAEGAA